MRRLMLGQRLSLQSQQLHSLPAYDVPATVLRAPRPRGPVGDARAHEVKAHHRKT